LFAIAKVVKLSESANVPEIKNADKNLYGLLSAFSK